MWGLIWEVAEMRRMRVIAARGALRAMEASGSIAMAFVAPAVLAPGSALAEGGRTDRPRNGWSAVVLMVVGALAVPAAGVAAGGNSIKINAPHTAQLGTPFHYSITGHSSSANKVNALAVFYETTVKCKASEEAESNSPSPSDSEYLSLKKRSFNVKVTFTPNSTGAHYICTYIFKNYSLKTLARAQSTYVTK